MSAPSSPTNAPSNTNGQRMKASEAPTSRMISISSARATTASRMVLTMMNSAMTPTMSSTTVPAVRRMFVTVRTRSTSFCCSLTDVDDRLVAEHRHDGPEDRAGRGA